MDNQNQQIKVLIAGIFLCSCLLSGLELLFTDSLTIHLTACSDVPGLMWGFFLFVFVCVSETDWCCIWSLDQSTGF